MVTGFLRGKLLLRVAYLHNDMSAGSCFLTSNDCAFNTNKKSQKTFQIYPRPDNLVVGIIKGAEYYCFLFVRVMKIPNNKTRSWVRVKMLQSYLESSNIKNILFFCFSEHAPYRRRSCSHPTRNKKKNSVTTHWRKRCPGSQHNCLRTSQSLARLKPSYKTT